MKEIVLDQNKARFQVGVPNILHIYSFSQHINGNAGKTLCGISMLEMRMLMVLRCDVKWICEECSELAERSNVAYRSNEQ